MDAALLESVLHGQAVEDGGEHARVIGRGTVHALRGRFHPAVDVPGPEYKCRLNAHSLHRFDLVREGLHAGEFDSVRLAPEESFAS